MYVPFSASVGYAIIKDPWAVHTKAAQTPKIAPDTTTKTSARGLMFDAL
jgi:hypothetical protein